MQNFSPISNTWRICTYSRATPPPCSFPSPCYKSYKTKKGRGFRELGRGLVTASGHLLRSSRNTGAFGSTESAGKSYKNGKYGYSYTMEGEEGTNNESGGKAYRNGKNGHLYTMEGREGIGNESAGKTYRNGKNGYSYSMEGREGSYSESAGKTYRNGKNGYSYSMAGREGTYSESTGKTYKNGKNGYLNTMEGREGANNESAWRANKYGNGTSQTMDGRKLTDDERWNKLHGIEESHAKNKLGYAQSEGAFGKQKKGSRNQSRRSRPCTVNIPGTNEIGTYCGSGGLNKSDASTTTAKSTNASTCMYENEPIPPVYNTAFSSHMQLQNRTPFAMYNPQCSPRNLGNDKFDYFTNRTEYCRHFCMSPGTDPETTNFIQLSLVSRSKCCACGKLTNNHASSNVLGLRFP